MAADRVTLTVPNRSDFAKTVRIAAAELASRVGMSYDDVNDVRMAAEEAFVYASLRVAPAAAVTFVFDIDRTGLTITVGPLEPAADEGRDTDLGARYATFILESVCDEVSVLSSEEVCSLMLVKRTAGVEA
ncbi:MAG TPA: ATP-binding protein [Coriobacteriia bacterium]|nr:ATP-binding protein [Coriobacteriia bacterium]